MQATVNRREHELQRPCCTCRTLSFRGTARLWQLPRPPSAPQPNHRCPSPSTAPSCPLLPTSPWPCSSAVLHGTPVLTLTAAPLLPSGSKFSQKQGSSWCHWGWSEVSTVHCQTGHEAPQTLLLRKWLSTLPLCAWTWGKRGKWLQCGLTSLLQNFAGAFGFCICSQFNQRLWIYCQHHLL